jgi:hypothetical protein
MGWKPMGGAVMISSAVMDMKPLGGCGLRKPSLGGARTDVSVQRRWKTNKV